MAQWRSDFNNSLYFYTDKKINLQTGSDAKQVIQANLLAPGSYTVKINWQAGKTHYYSEQAFKI